jgi:hypothetical protein
MLQELLLVLSGISGGVTSRDNDNDSINISSIVLRKLNDQELELLKKLVKIGSDYAFIMQFINYHKNCSFIMENGEYCGLILSALCYGMDKYILEGYRLVYLSIYYI